MRKPTADVVRLMLSMFALLLGQGCSSSHVAPAFREEPSLSAAAIEQIWSTPSRSQTSGHLSLDQAIEEALAASPELEQIRRRLDGAAEQVGQAKAAFYPRLVFTEEYNITDNPVFALMHIINQRRLLPTTDFNNPGVEQNFQSRIQGEWSVFQGGKRWAGHRAARFQQRSVAAELLAARNELVATVSETYYRWLQALDFIKVAERALEAAGTNERIGEARLRAETALPSEVLRLKAQRAESHSNLVSARIGARRLQAALERLLARPIRSEEIPKPTAAAASAPLTKPAKPSRLVDQAIRQRPEMEVVQALVFAARERIRIKRGELLPSLDVQSNYQWDSEDLNGGGDSWMLGIRATWALFEGGMRLSKIREAEAHLRELQARGRQIALDIALEVHQAALGVQEAAEKIQVAEDRKQWAQQGLNEVRNLYQNQVVTVDALLQAEVAWNRAEVAYTAALFDGMIAQTALRQTLGEFADWMERADEP
jgi:outer membrane protein